VLVGGSFGASLTLWTAAHSPDRVAGAVAMAPSGMPGELRSPWPRSFLFKPGLANSVAMALARSPLFGGLFANSQARQGLGISRSYDEGFEAAMPKVRAPVVLFWSPSDPTAPYAYRDHYLRAIPQAKLMTFAERSGHNIVGTEPDLVAKHICEFVAQLPGATAAER
jgi:pimeloyl-ACP methyl ester carboxylesterase